MFFLGNIIIYELIIKYVNFFYIRIEKLLNYNVVIVYYFLFLIFNEIDGFWFFLGIYFGNISKIGIFFCYKRWILICIMLMLYVF